MGNPGILYFSSTGNSLYIAKKAKEFFGGEIRYIPNYTKDGSEYDFIVIVTPIYSFGLPVPVSELLPKLDKNVRIFVVQNYGGMAGGADGLFYKYAAEYGLNVKSIYKTKMPENFTLIMSPPAFFVKSVLKSADKRLEKIFSDIKSGNYHIPKIKKTREKTYLKNKSNWYKIGERFSVTDKCIGCGKCVNVCPANNITMTVGCPIYGKSCIACLGCFHRCHEKAIIYMGKDNKKRYINPNVPESEIGKDLK